MVNTAFPVSVPPVAVVTPLSTVIWPPVGNVSVAVNAISTASSRRDIRDREVRDRMQNRLGPFLDFLAPNKKPRDACVWRACGDRLSVRVAPARNNLSLTPVTSCALGSVPDSRRQYSLRPRFRPASSAAPKNKQHCLTP